MGAQILDITPDAYHRDPCEVPALSASIAKVLVDKSPAHAWLEHPRLGGQRSDPTRAMDAGTVLHRMILGKGAEVVEVPHADYRTKAAQTARDEAKAAGKTPMLSHELAGLREACERITERLHALGIHLEGRSEVAVTWEEPVFMSNALVQCRAMFDHTYLDDGVIFDLKKCVSANPGDLQRVITSYGYDIQHAAYTSAMRAVRPDVAGRERFTFIFVEAEPPYAVTPVRLTGEFRELGQKRWDRAVRTWHRCTTENRWPAYVDGIVDIEPAPWAMAREAL